MQILMGEETLGAYRPGRGAWDTFRSASPRPRVPASPRPRVPASPRPRVPASPRPRVIRLSLVSPPS